MNVGPNKVGGLQLSVYYTGGVWQQNYEKKYLKCSNSGKVCAFIEMVKSLLYVTVNYNFALTRKKG